MSAIWSLAYVHTQAKEKRVLLKLSQALSAEIDHQAKDMVYRDGIKHVAYPPHEVTHCPPDFDPEAIYQDPRSVIRLYPRHEGLYTVEFLYIFSPENVLFSDRASQFARVERFDQMMCAFSRGLKAEIAWVLFVRNPAGRITCVKLYRAGAVLDEYFNFELDGMPSRLERPSCDNLADFIDGRFLFLCAPALNEEEGCLFHFDGENLGQKEANPRYSVYDPAVSRLYVPFWRDDLKPSVEIGYDFDALLTRTFIRGTAPRPKITGLAPLPPACVLRQSENVEERTLTITGKHFPAVHQGLQFKRVDDRRLSIVFGMEVDWESTIRITLDMARIKHLLWSDARLPLRVRLMDCENANYQPQSDWSPEFILADDAAACSES